MSVAAVAQAGPSYPATTPHIMNGSLPTITINGTSFTNPLTTATQFSFTGIAVSGGGNGTGGASGDYSVIPSGTYVGNDAHLTTSLALGSTPSYSIDFASNLGDYGTFKATSADRIGQSQAGSSSSVTLYLLGDFTPGAYLISQDSTLQNTPSPTSEIITINQTSSSTSSSSTLSSPPVPETVPEPGSLLLLGTGIAGLGLVLARRRHGGGRVSPV